MAPRAKSKRDRAKARTDALTKFGVAAGAGALKGGPAAAGIAAGAVAVQLLLSALFDAYHEREEHRARRWFDGYVASAGGTPAAVAEDLRTRLTDPVARDVVYQHMRQVRDAIDEAAAPYLGALALPCVRGPRHPDAFERGMMRVLCDVTAGEIEGLRWLTQWAAGLALNGQAVRLTFVETHTATQVMATWPPGRHTEDTQREEAEAPPAARRLWQTLLTHGVFDHDEVGLVGEDWIGAVSAKASAETIERLRALFA